MVRSSPQVDDSLFLTFNGEGFAAANSTGNRDVFSENGVGRKCFRSERSAADITLLLSGPGNSLRGLTPACLSFDIPLRARSGTGSRYPQAQRITRHLSGHQRRAVALQSSVCGTALRVQFWPQSKPGDGVALCCFEREKVNIFGGGSGGFRVVWAEGYLGPPRAISFRAMNFTPSRTAEMGITADGSGIGFVVPVPISKFGPYYVPAGPRPRRWLKRARVWKFRASLFLISSPARN